LAQPQAWKAQRSATAATLVAEAADGEPVSLEYGFSMAEGCQLGP
jgi:hypothetical protein